MVFLKPGLSFSYIFSVYIIFSTTSFFVFANIFPRPGLSFSYTFFCFCILPVVYTWFFVPETCSHIFFLSPGPLFSHVFLLFCFFLFFAYWSPKFWRKEQQKIMNRQPQHFEKKKKKHASSSKFLLPLCVPFWHFGSRSGVWVNIIWNKI